MIGVDKPQIVKQRGDIEQLRVELYLLAVSLHRAKHEHSNRVVEQQLTFMLPHQFGGRPRDLAVRNFDVRNDVGHCRTPISV